MTLVALCSPSRHTESVREGSLSAQANSLPLGENAMAVTRSVGRARMVAVGENPEGDGIAAERDDTPKGNTASCFMLRQSQM